LVVFRPGMTRLPALVLALEMLGVPAAGRAGDLYSFVDGDGVIHVTNVPQDTRYRRLKVRLPDYDGVHRITLNGRRSPPRHLRRNTGAYDEHIREAAQKYGLAPPLLKAVMAAESNFDPSAVSVKGATGLMQLMPATAREMSVADPRDPAQNIEGGARPTTRGRRPCAGRAAPSPTSRRPRLTSARCSSSTKAT
jgi:hypothetical protein